MRSPWRQQLWGTEWREGETKIESARFTESPGGNRHGRQPSVLRAALLQRGDRDSSMCVWGLVSDADLVVVEDIALDLRFLRHECCQWAKPLRFLGCAPLTAANGHRIGYM